ncbi:MAG: hypothetical protein AAB091_07250 [Elusimicrobiota bacterium]
MLEFLIENLPVHDIRIVRTIVEEVNSKLSPEQTKEFFAFINAFTSVDEKWVVPFDLGEKYLAFLKKGDAAIAAYTEFVGAQALVSENRKHFHTHKGRFPFVVWDAATCLKELKKLS